LTAHALLREPSFDLDQLMATAYRLFQQGRYADVDRLCATLTDLDRGYWWCHSLRASALARLGRYQTALDAVERGLHHEPEHPKLLGLRTEILAAIGAALVSRALPPRRGPRSVPPRPSPAGHLTVPFRRPGSGR
jgi:tetratricopeptide (TPR) repeat protein